MLYIDTIYSINGKSSKKIPGILCFLWGQAWNIRFFKHCAKMKETESNIPGRTPNSLH
jgi:hypothetical protein